MGLNCQGGVGWQLTTGRVGQSPGPSPHTVTHCVLWCRDNHPPLSALGLSVGSMSGWGPFYPAVRVRRRGCGRQYATHRLLARKIPQGVGTPSASIGVERLVVFYVEEPEFLFGWTATARSRDTVVLGGKAFDDPPIPQSRRPALQPCTYRRCRLYM